MKPDVPKSVRSLNGRDLEVGRKFTVAEPYSVLIQETIKDGFPSRASYELRVGDVLEILDRPDRSDQFQFRIEGERDVVLAGIDQLSEIIIENEE